MRGSGNFSENLTPKASQNSAPSSEKAFHHFTMSIESASISPTFMTTIFVIYTDINYQVEIQISVTVNITFKAHHDYNLAVSYIQSTGLIVFVIALMNTQSNQLENLFISV